MCRSYRTCKKDYSSNSSICTCENGKHLKNIADDSKIECDEFIYVLEYMEYISYCINKCGKDYINKCVNKF